MLLQPLQSQITAYNITAHGFGHSPCAQPASSGFVSRRAVNCNACHRIFHIDIVHIYVYSSNMKKRELEKLLRQLGWKFLRHGGKHDIWTNGKQEEAIPRHAEINERLARLILRRARRKG